MVQDFVGGCVWEGLGGIWENTTFYNFIINVKLLLEKLFSNF